MVIGFDGSRAFSKRRTGTENYSYYLLKNLAKIDRENSYFVYIRPDAEVDRDEWPANFRFILIDLPRFWTQFGLSFRTFIDKIDVLFVTAHTLPLLRKPGLKTVMTVHDLGSEYLPAMHQLKQRVYLGFITSFQLRSVTQLIAVSRATKEDLVSEVKVSPLRVAVVYEGVDRRIFKPFGGRELANTLKSYNLEDKNFFLFVGTIQPRKNIKMIINAYNSILQKLPEDMKLVLVGNKGWLSEDMYRIPSELGVEKRVCFLGAVSNEDLPKLYSGARALVFPSLFEGFGLPILEAFACDCPVVTSNLSSMPEVAGGAAVLVDPYSEKQVAWAMLKLLREKFRQELIRLGRKRVEEFSWERCAEQTLSVLRLVVNRVD